MTALDRSGPPSPIVTCFVYPPNPATSCGTTCPTETTRSYELSTNERLTANGQREAERSTEYIVDLFRGELADRRDVLAPTVVQ